MSYNDDAKDLEAYLKKALDLKMPDIPRERKLRVSGFPYCGLKDLFTRLERLEESDTSSDKEFYCNVGTAAHSVWQRAMGSLGQIYGDWKCLKCDHTTEFSASNKCDKCGSEMQYEEFTVVEFRHVSGHLDGLFLVKKSGNWYVIDYKTCSVRIIMMHKAALRNGTKSMLPYGKNVHQISSYVPMIERKLKIKVSGWFLLYLARDRPKYFAIVGKAMSAEDKHQALSRVAYYDSVYDRVENCKSFSDVKWIIKNKPCKNREVYSEHFQGFKPCPLEAVCFDKARLLDVLKQSWESNK